MNTPLNFALDNLQMLGLTNPPPPYVLHSLLLITAELMTVCKLFFCAVPQHTLNLLCFNKFFNDVHFHMKPFLLLCGPQCIRKTSSTHLASPLDNSENKVARNMALSISLDTANVSAASVLCTILFTLFDCQESGESFHSNTSEQPSFFLECLHLKDFQMKHH